MLLIVGPLCIGLMSTVLSYMGSRHRHTVLFGCDTLKKPLHHSTVFLHPAVQVFGVLLVFLFLFLNGYL